MKNKSQSNLATQKFLLLTDIKLIYELSKGSKV